MSRLRISLSLCAAGALFTGCFTSEDDDDSNDAAGQAYVAVGNSLTAGFQSGGLRQDWQEVSYPVLIAKQIGMADFQIPTIKSPGVGRAKTPTGGNTTPLYYDTATKAIKYDAFDANTTVSSLLTNSTLNRPYNNLGVPGATTKDFLYAYDSSSGQVPGNGFFNIVLRGSLNLNQSMMRQAIRLKPQLLTMWIGNNDILGGITLGTVVEGVTVTPSAAYGAMINAAIDTLLAETNANIFVANIPSIPTIPFVTTIPPVVLNPATNQPVLDSANKPIPLKTQETGVQYVLLTAQAEMAGPDKRGIPAALGGKDSLLQANFTLTATEVATANKLVKEYNDILKARAEADARVYLVDVNGLLDRLNKGEITGLSSKFFSLDPANTAFSLDGIHPNAKGYKAIANLFLEAINAGLGSSYTLVP